MPPTRSKKKAIEMFLGEDSLVDNNEGVMIEAAALRGAPR
ncbi:hypothetical protein SXM_0715 [Shewanella xiamenensis]|nr:hypothetical protein SXM_0715 [Shewanella xiamenensis]